MTDLNKIKTACNNPLLKWAINLSFLPAKLSYISLFKKNKDYVLNNLEFIYKSKLLDYLDIDHAINANNKAFNDFFIKCGYSEQDIILISLYLLI